MAFTPSSTSLTLSDRVQVARFLVGALLAVSALLPLACNRHRKEPPAATAATMPQFTDGERRAIQAYWNATGRYVVESPAPDKEEAVRITVAGSTWRSLVNKEMTRRRQTIGGDVDVRTWDAWIKMRTAWEKARLTPGAPTPSDPGPVPQALRDAVGEPPPLFARVRPNRYTITFAPEDAPAPIVYYDAYASYDASPSFRSANGVMRVGKRLHEYTGDELRRATALFGKAASDPFERRVVQAVSALEGGFEAVNTYDTGFVSIGFIQFITARNGDGSLSAVLLRHRTDAPSDYQTTFRRFGIDVATVAGADPVLVVIDPQTGRELRGADAVQAVINDKRLTAVFERAGTLSDEFRIAQIRTARARYWPGDDVVTVFAPVSTGAPAPSVGSPTLTAKVSDLVKSEAGMATLMDRKVNRGNIREINAVAARIMQEKKLTNLADVARYERLLIEGMKYRGDYLKDPKLSQPPPSPAP